MERSLASKLERMMPDVPFRLTSDGFLRDVLMEFDKNRVLYICQPGIERIGRCARIGSFDLSCCVAAFKFCRRGAVFERCCLRQYRGNENTCS